MTSLRRARAIEDPGECIGRVKAQATFGRVPRCGKTAKFRIPIDPYCGIHAKHRLDELAWKRADERIRAEFPRRAADVE